MASRPLWIPNSLNERVANREKPCHLTINDSAQAEVVRINLSRSGRYAWRGRHSGIAVFQAEGGQVIGERAHHGVNRGFGYLDLPRCQPGTGAWHSGLRSAGASTLRLTTFHKVSSHCCCTRRQHSVRMLAFGNAIRLDIQFGRMTVTRIYAATREGSLGARSGSARDAR